MDELLDERHRSPRDNLLSALIAAEEAGKLLTDAALQARAACRRRSQAPFPATGSPNGYGEGTAHQPSPDAAVAGYAGDQGVG